MKKNKNHLPPTQTKQKKYNAPKWVYIVHVQKKQTTCTARNVVRIKLNMK